MKQILDFSNLKSKKVELGDSGTAQTCIFDKDGGSIIMTVGESCVSKENISKTKYLYFDIAIDSDLSALISLTFHRELVEKPDLYVLCGLLPKIKTRVCLDFEALEGNTLFREPRPGNLKQVVFGTKLPIDEIKMITISAAGRIADLKTEISDITFSDTVPEFPVPNTILCDKYGQSTIKNLENSIKSDEELMEVFNKYINSEFDDKKFKYSKFGGCLSKKFDEGNGYFRTKHDGKRWWLVDPNGHAFISSGFDCIGCHSAGRIDGKENLFEKLESEDGAYKDAWEINKGVKHYDFSIANLIRVFGENWKRSWEEITYKRIRNWGINTAGAWSDYDFIMRSKVPYAYTMKDFPTTENCIFRDFPDVFDPTYEQNSILYANGLSHLKEDPYMIGYFMRNEPEWAFVQKINIAEQMMASKMNLTSKAVFIERLKEKYSDISTLNNKWETDFSEFEDLYTPIFRACEISKATEADLREFSEILIRRYVELPANACKKIDPNHLNLGMRYAFISDPTLIAGWENFDVFSINSYSISPYKQIDEVAKIVDIPIVIGEFHFGALESGMYATGLRAVETQKDRATAYKHYMSEVIRHPYGIGAHYFTLNDQALLGRFDGENYQIGAVAIDQNPYQDFVDGIIDFNMNMYEIAEGVKPYYLEPAKEVPRIAY